MRPKINNHSLIHISLQETAGGRAFKAGESKEPLSKSELNKSDHQLNKTSDKASAATVKQSKAAAGKSEAKETNRSSSANSKETAAAADPKQSRSSSRQSIDDDEAAKPHRYIVEATVLKDSWPLTKTQWNFVSLLRENESNELKVFVNGRVGSPTKEAGKKGGGGAGGGGGGSSSSTAAANKGGKPAAGGKSKGTPNQGVSRPASSSTFDGSRPFWSLKWISDAAAADSLEVRKETGRVEEIRAMKKAWESHEPGRFAKAQLSRGEFLKR